MADRAGVVRSAPGGKLWLDVRQKRWVCKVAWWWIPWMQGGGGHCAGAPWRQQIESKSHPFQILARCTPAAGKGVVGIVLERHGESALN